MLFIFMNNFLIKDLAGNEFHNFSRGHYGYNDNAFIYHFILYHMAVKVQMKYYHNVIILAINRGMNP